MKPATKLFLINGLSCVSICSTLTIKEIALFNATRCKFLTITIEELTLPPPPPFSFSYQPLPILSINEKLKTFICKYQMNYPIYEQHTKNILNNSTENRFSYLD